MVDYPRPDGDGYELIENYLFQNMIQDIRTLNPALNGTKGLKTGFIVLPKKELD